MPLTHDGFLNDHHRENHRKAKLLLIEISKKSGRSPEEAIAQAKRLRSEAERNQTPSKSGRATAA